MQILLPKIFFAQEVRHLAVGLDFYPMPEQTVTGDLGITFRQCIEKRLSANRPVNGVHFRPHIQVELTDAHTVCSALVEDAAVVALERQNRRLALSPLGTHRERFLTINQNCDHSVGVFHAQFAYIQGTGKRIEGLPFFVNQDIGGIENPQGQVLSADIKQFFIQDLQGVHSYGQGEQTTFLTAFPELPSLRSQTDIQRINGRINGVGRHRDGQVAGKETPFQIRFGEFRNRELRLTNLSFERSVEHTVQMEGQLLGRKGKQAFEVRNTGGIYSIKGVRFPDRDGGGFERSVEAFLISGTQLHIHAHLAPIGPGRTLGFERNVESTDFKTVKVQEIIGGIAFDNAGSQFDGHPRASHGSQGKGGTGGRLHLHRVHPALQGKTMQAEKDGILLQASGHKKRVDGQFAAKLAQGIRADIAAQDNFLSPHRGKKRIL